VTDPTPPSTAADAAPPATSAVLERWQQDWPRALTLWSRYTRLQMPQLRESRVEAAEQGLQGSFAMIRLKDQRIVIDLDAILTLGLADYGVEILAHEIGHHVLIPGNMTDQLRLLARIRAGLPTLERQAPMVANLYADLLINDRLQRQEELRLADVYRRLAGERTPGATEVASRVWDLYLRIYEQLWKLPHGDLGAGPRETGIDADAWLGARLVRVYASDWLSGAGGFAALLLPYLVEDAERAEQAVQQLMDTLSAGEGCEPYGGLDITGDEAAARHPSLDPAVTGDDTAREGQGDHTTPVDAADTDAHTGQCREPFDYGELLRAAGLKIDDHEAAVRYYRERALPHLVPFPKRSRPGRSEPLVEGLDPWEIGDAVDLIDPLQSVLVSPRVIPGVTTVQRHYGEDPSPLPVQSPIDLDLYVDSSGSMPNPQVQVSYPSLAGAVIALSALRSGAKVQVTLWSGKQQVMHTDGFVRDESAILRILTGFYGGGTAFPIHRLRDTYLNGRPRDRLAHVLMISDDGISTMFDQDERGHHGWDIAAKALAAAGGGGSMALQLPQGWEQQTTGWQSQALEWIRRAQREQGWEVQAIRDLEDLMAFARSFARKHYG
jgi:hypothetical protein